MHYAERLLICQRSLRRFHRTVWQKSSTSKIQSVAVISVLLMCGPALYYHYYLSVVHKKYDFCCVQILTGSVCKTSLMCVWAVFILKRCSVGKIENDRTRGNSGCVNFLHIMTEPITISDHTHTHTHIHTYRFISSQNPNIDGNFLMKKRKTRLT